MKKSRGLIAITAVAIALAAAIPVLAHYLFAALGWIFSMIGAGFSLLAVWFAKASDEPHEKAIWGGILLTLIFAFLIYFGLPLLDYWWLIAIFAIIFIIAIFNVKIKERRKKK